MRTRRIRPTNWAWPSTQPQEQCRQRIAAPAGFSTRTCSLDALNNGKGVRLGSFTHHRLPGATSGVNLRTSEAKTVGDVLELINGLGLAVEARINDTGDGIMLRRHGQWRAELSRSWSRDPDPRPRI